MARLSGVKKAEPLKDLIISIPQDERIVNLVKTHTYKGKHESVLRCLTMIASGTKTTTACKACGIPEQTYYSWYKQPWLHEVISTLKEQMDTQLDNSLTGTTHRALDALNDRITNGDTVVNPRTGEAYKKPMSGRDVGIAFSTVFDKRQLLRGKATSVSESVKTEEALDKIAKRFQDMAVIEGEFEFVEEEDDNIQETEIDESGV